MAIDQHIVVQKHDRSMGIPIEQFIFFGSESI